MWGLSFPPSTLICLFTAFNNVIDPHSPSIDTPNDEHKKREIIRSNSMHGIHPSLPRQFPTTISSVQMLLSILCATIISSVSVLFGVFDVEMVSFVSVLFAFIAWLTALQQRIWWIVKEISSRNRLPAFTLTKLCALAPCWATACLITISTVHIYRVVFLFGLLSLFHLNHKHLYHICDIAIAMHCCMLFPGRQLLTGTPLFMAFTIKSRLIQHNDTHKATRKQKRDRKII